MNGESAHLRTRSAARLVTAAAAIAAAGAVAVPSVAVAADGSPAVDRQQTSGTVQQTSASTDRQQASGTVQRASKSDGQAGSAAASKPRSGGEGVHAPDSLPQDRKAKNLDSGTDGSYAKHGIYRVTVRYVDGKGAQIAPSWQRELAAGSSWSAKSPSIGGYRLADASKAELSGTARGSEHNPVYTVVYDNVMTTYKVVVELQVGDDYRVDQERTLPAPAGTVVTAQPKDIAEYHCVTPASKRSTTVTADGSAVIVLRYDQDVPSYGVYFKTGGSYVAPITGHKGDAIAAPAHPKKPGYRFVGWDIDGDGKADALLEKIPGRDVVATAVWAPAEATYQVRYYLQRSHDAYGGEKHYRLSKTRILTGRTESATPAAERLATEKGAAYQCYQYAHETSAIIAGDGSTIVNVYYDLKPVKVHYYVSIDGSHVHNADMIETKTLLMYQMLTDATIPEASKVRSYYKAHGGTASDFEGYYSYEGGYFFLINASSLTPADVSFSGDGTIEANIAALFDNNITTYYSGDIYEGVTPGDYTRRPLFATTGRSGNNQYLIVDNPSSRWMPYQWRSSTGKWDGAEESAIAWSAWHTFDESTKDSYGRYHVPSSDKYFDRNKENVLEIRWARRSYTVTYYSNGAQVGSITRRFGERFAAGEGVDASVLAPHDGLVFAGWTGKPQSSAIVPSELTMPSQNASLYAVWKHPDVQVKFDSHGGTSVASQMLAWDGKAKTPENPSREGYLFGGWYYYGEGSSVPARFSFDMPIDHDLVLHAAWKSAGEKTSYTVVHVSKDGTELSRDTEKGLVGETVTALPLAPGNPARAGYRYVSSSGSTIDLSPDARNNVVTFVYDKDPSYVYIVRGVDAKTGRDITGWTVVPSGNVVVDVNAPQVNGWTVRGAGQGYVGADGSREVVFLYDRDASSVPSGHHGGAHNPSDAHGQLHGSQESGVRGQHAKPASAPIGSFGSEKAYADTPVGTPAASQPASHVIPETGDDAMGGTVATILAAAGSAGAAAWRRRSRRHARQ